MPSKADTAVARTIGIDTGKNTLHMIGLDEKGAIVLREKVSRTRIATRLANVPPCADGGYAEEKMASVVSRTGRWTLQIVKRSATKGFEVLPKRWIVERTFAWISRNRRLARDFERYAATVVAFVRVAMIRIMLRRLAATTSS